MAVFLVFIGISVAYRFFDLGPTNQGLQKESSVPTEKADSLIYTRHALCRMDCRQIDKTEVQDIAANGTINVRKSNPAAKPCPVVSKERRSKDGQLIRVVIGDCEAETKIVTVIDLENDFPCSCD